MILFVCFRLAIWFLVLLSSSHPCLLDNRQQIELALVDRHLLSIKSQLAHSGLNDPCRRWLFPLSVPLSPLVCAAAAQLHSPTAGRLHAPTPRHYLLCHLTLTFVSVFPISASLPSSGRAQDTLPTCFIACFYSYYLHICRHIPYFLHIALRNCHPRRQCTRSLTVTASSISIPNPSLVLPIVSVCRLGKRTICTRCNLSSLALILSLYPVSHSL